MSQYLVLTNQNMSSRYLICNFKLIVIGIDSFKVFFFSKNGLHYNGHQDLSKHSSYCAYIYELKFKHIQYWTSLEENAL